MDMLRERIRLLTRSYLWAVHPAALPLVLAPVSHPSVAGDFTWTAAKPSVQGRGDNRIAIVPIEGVLSKDGPAWYGSNYDTITNAVEQAAADPSIKHIVLAVDSPGGEVTGLPETAATIAAAAKVKPVSAIVDGMAASAAYWLASQSREIALTPSGQVGSVGVRMMHADVSKMLGDMGVNITELYSGDYKTEWSPFHALTDEAKAVMQSRLEAMHGNFLADVAAGRGERASKAMRESRFGEGRMFDAPEAMGGGLVDKVTPTRDFFRAIAPPQEEEPVPTYGMPRRARVDLERAKF